MMRYFVAYEGKDGTQFGENIPWIAPSEYGFSEKNDAIIEQNSLIKLGYTNVHIFYVEIDDRQEEYDWEYIKEHIIQ